MKMKDFHFFIYDEVQITPNIFSFKVHVISAVIDNFTHRANRIQWGIAKPFYIRPWPQGQKRFIKFQTLGEEGFYMFPTVFEGADSKFNCYQSCTPAVLHFEK